MQANARNLGCGLLPMQAWLVLAQGVAGYVWNMGASLVCVGCVVKFYSSLRRSAELEDGFVIFVGDNEVGLRDLTMPLLLERMLHTTLLACL